LGAADYCWVNGVLVSLFIDARSKEGRRAIARFHSDACWTLKSTAPRWYRRIFDHRIIRTFASPVITPDDLCYLGLLDVGRRIHDREVSSFEVTETLLQRIAELDVQLRSYALDTRFSR
jgi:hypothetical protein